MSVKKGPTTVMKLTLPGGDTRGLAAVSAVNAEAFWAQGNAEILNAFVALIAHDTGATARLHQSAIRAGLARYELFSGPKPSLLQVVTTPSLLASLFSLDNSLQRPGEIIGRNTLKHLRGAMRAFVGAVPVPPGIDRAVLRKNVADACCTASRQRGTRYLVKEGRKGPAALRYVPTAKDVQTIVETLTLMPHPLAGGTADLVAFVYGTGIRIGAALELTSNDLNVLPDGRAWAYTAEKARPDRRPVLLSGPRSLIARWREIEPHKSLWDRDGHVLKVHIARQLLRRAQVAAGVEIFSFHRLRHAFASDLAPYVGLKATMRAGGWVAERSVEGYRHLRDEVDHD